MFSYDYIACLKHEGTPIGVRLRNRSTNSLVDVNCTAYELYKGVTKGENSFSLPVAFKDGDYLSKAELDGKIDVMEAVKPFPVKPVHLSFANKTLLQLLSEEWAVSRYPVEKDSGIVQAYSPDGLAVVTVDCSLISTGLLADVFVVHYDGVRIDTPCNLNTASITGMSKRCTRCKAEGVLQKNGTRGFICNYCT